MNADLFLKNCMDGHGNERDKADHLPSGQASNLLARGQVFKSVETIVLYCVVCGDWARATLNNETL